MATATAAPDQDIIIIKKHSNKTMERNKEKKAYQAPQTRLVQIETESGICAGSNVSVKKDSEPLVEVDKWDEIGQDITFE